MGMWDGGAESGKRQLRATLVVWILLDIFYGVVLVHRWTHPSRVHGGAFSHQIFQFIFSGIVVPIVCLQPLFRQASGRRDVPLHVTPTGSLGHPR